MNPVALDLHSSRPAQRRRDLRAGVRIEIVTVVWMAVEALVALAAGLVAHSVLLTAFGLDSVVELVSGGALLWRLAVEARDGALARVERAENIAAWIAAAGLGALCLYIVAVGAAGLALHHTPDGSLPGIALSIAAVVAMPVLFWRKRAIASRIGSAALRADAACSLTCAYMAATLLVGLAATALLGWWWADSVAALGLLAFIVPEAREALEGARAGRGGCSCGDSGCGE